MKTEILKPSTAKRVGEIANKIGNHYRKRATKITGAIMRNTPKNIGIKHLDKINKTSLMAADATAVGGIGIATKNKRKNRK